MTNQIDIMKKNHRRAVHFFWCLLIGATTVSLLGNVAHSVLPYLPKVVIQIGAAAVPPIALLAAVHGIALAVRAGASGTGLPLGSQCYGGNRRRRVRGELPGAARSDARHRVHARDCMGLPRHHRHSSCSRHGDACCAGDKPARRTRTATMPASAQTPAVKRAAQSANPQVMPVRSAQDAGTGGASRPGKGLASVQVDLAQAVRSAQTEAAQADGDLASDLIASGVTAQSVDTVVAVLAAHHAGASINAAAKASGINYRTAQRIVGGAAEHRQRQLVAVG